MIPRGAWLGARVDPPVHGEVWLIRAAACEVGYGPVSLQLDPLWCARMREGERAAYLRALPVVPLWRRLLAMVSL